MTRFFRINGIAAAATLLLLATACSKEGEVEAKTQADAEGRLNGEASASANASDTAVPAATNKPAPPPAGTAGNSKVLLKVTTNDGTGMVPLKPNTTVTLPYRANVMFDPPLPMSACGVKAGPFVFWESDNGAVAKFEPNEADLAKLEKGETLDVTLRLSNVEFPFRVSMRQ